MRDKLLGLLLEGLLRGVDKDKDKDSGPAADSPKINKKPEKVKEYSLRELVERQDDSGVRKLLNDKPFMVSYILYTIVKIFFLDKERQSCFL